MKRIIMMADVLSSLIVLLAFPFCLSESGGRTDGGMCLVSSTSPGKALVECKSKSGREMADWLKHSTLQNMTALLLTVDDKISYDLDFTGFHNLTYLSLHAAESLSESLSNMSGLTELKWLNLSSNNLKYVADLSRFEILTHLDLSNNSLQEIDFQSLPPSVLFLNLRSNRMSMSSNVTLPPKLQRLDLSDNRIDSIEPILSESLQYLNLSANNISNLSFITHLVSVEQLDLSVNNISEIEDDSFSTLAYLIRLDLSRNSLRFLKEKSFTGLNKLQILDISHNLLQSITPGTFQYLNNLMWLSLSDNRGLGRLDAVEDTSILLGTGQRLQTVDASRTNLTKVPNTLTRSIRNLYLCCNRISAIRCGDLDSFLLLQTLDLSSNSLSSIEEDALGRSELLFYLLLAENSLASIPHSLPDNLLALDLDHNFIRNISANDFIGLSKLRTLRLAWNKVQVINDGAFGQLSSLQNLDLSGNPLKILSSGTFVGPRWLVGLSLASLTSLIPTKNTLAFPVPESGHLQVLNIQHSPVLVSQLLEDVAALSMFRQLSVLNLAYSNLTNIRSDLVNYFPRLKVLDLRGNRLNCTDLIWLSRWLRRMREDKNDQAEELQHLEKSHSIHKHEEQQLQPQYPEAEFHIVQDVNDYEASYREATNNKGPTCGYPAHLIGVPLDELSVPISATSQLPRYERQHLNLKTVFDHDFYQNDFPLSVNEPNAKQEHTTDPTDVVGRQTKVSSNKKIENVTNSASNLTQIKTYSIDKIPLIETKNKPNNTEKTINIKTFNYNSKTNFTKVIQKVVSSNAFKSKSKGKLAVLSVDNSVRNVSVGDDHQLLESDGNNTAGRNHEWNKSNTSINNSDSVMESVHSPLEMTAREVNEGGEKSEPYQSKSTEDEIGGDKQSVIPPQKISIYEDADRSKEDGPDEVIEEARYTHHPGLVVFVVAAGLLGIAALVMRASQRRQSRNGYAQQQDIEVRSLDLSGHELW